MNFCGFRCATKSPITVFINVVFYIYYRKRLLLLLSDKTDAVPRSTGCLEDKDV